MRASAHRQLALFAPRTFADPHTRDIVDVITMTVAEHFHADIHTVRSPTRRQPIAQVRMVAMYVARQVAALGPCAIGSVLGRDHATVTHGVRTIEAGLVVDPFLRRSVDAVMAKATAAVAMLAAG